MMVSNPIRVSLALSLSILLRQSMAFTPLLSPFTVRQTSSTTTTTTSSSPLHMTPFHPTDFMDHVDTLTTAWSTHVVPHSSDPSHFFSSLLTADAASPQETASKLVEMESATGLKAVWFNYLKLFKGGLLAVHGAIDGPLRSIGFDQTWGPSIFLFTALARACVLPLSIEQSKNSEYMKALKPYVTQISEKFKDNEQAKQRAVGKLYQDAQQNPLAGCLTSLATIPIFLGLYRGIRLLALDGELDEPFLWIPSLQGPVSPPDYRDLDWLVKGWTFPEGGLPVPPMGWEATLPFLVMPLVLIVLQSTTMSILQPPVDENASEEERESLEKTQRIFKFLPLMIGFFSLQVPAGLTIYWLTSNLFTLASSLGVRAYFKANPPKIELPDYWDKMVGGKADFDSMTPEERREATEAGIRVGPTMEQLVDEARFHVYVNRQPLRVSSDVLASARVPSELEDWVQQGKSTSSTETHSEAATASTTADYYFTQRK